MSAWAAALDELVRHAVVRPERVEAIQRTLAPNQRQDAVTILQRLIDSGRVTPWQIAEAQKGNAAALSVDRYVLRAVIGRGGMGVVYEAWHRELDRLEAMKLIRPDQQNDEDSLGRFLREARIVARLSHDHIVQTFNCGRVADGRCFLAMERLCGADLEQTVRRGGPIVSRETLDILRQAASGLAFAHGQPQPIVHRDIKPSNLFLTDAGRVKILDLGLSRMKDWPTDATYLQTLTETGAFKGTVQYVSPEQIADPRAADARSDIYSLGCTLYFLLTGVTAFGGGNVLQTIRAHDQGRYPPLEDVRPDLPQELVGLCRRMMARRPEDRFATCHELIAAIDETTESLRTFAVRIAGSVVAPETPTVLAEPALAGALPDERTHPPATASTLQRPPRAVSHAPHSTATRLSEDRVAWDWRVVPAGEFLAGCDERQARRLLSVFAVQDPQECERWLLGGWPARRPFLSEYRIARFPVTCRQYGQFLDATGHKPPLKWTEQRQHLEADLLPVVGVSFDDATAFCGWAGVRLPAGDEWEKAARGTDGRLFPWGDVFDPARCNTTELGLGDWLAVDQLPEGDSPYGARQMIGNVWEWTIGPQGVPELRGSSCWSSGRLSGPAFFSTPAEASYANLDVGFRVLL